MNIFRKKTHFIPKTACITLLLCTLNTINAQQFGFEMSYSNPVRFGTNISNTFLHQNKVGITFNTAITSNFSIFSGLYYSLAYGNKTQMYPNNDYVATTSYAQFGDLPLYLMFNLPVSNTFKFFAFGGPSLNFGISHKQHILSTLATQSPMTNDMYASNALSRWNMQLGTGGGLQWKKFILKGGYDFGIFNLDPSKSIIIHQSGWYATIGYELENLKKAKQNKSED
jgi:hypothetical protein